MDSLKDALRVIADKTPSLTHEELQTVLSCLADATKCAKRRQQDINKKPKTPSQSGPAAVIQQLDNSYGTIKDVFEKGFPESRRPMNILPNDVADTQRTPTAQVRKGLANLCLASVHNRCDEIGKAEKKILKTRLEAMLDAKPGDTSFTGTVKYFIEVNKLGHIAQLKHGLSKLGELQGLLAKYEGFAEENRGWFRRWLALYEGEVRMDIAPLKPSVQQLHGRANPSLLHPIDDLAGDTVMTKDQQACLIAGWRAATRKEDQFFQLDCTKGSITGGEFGDWSRSPDFKYSQTNIMFINNWNQVGGEARKRRASSSRLCQGTVQPLARPNRDPGRHTSPPHKRNRC